jgi:exopolysaccharide production protein ExoZ
MLYKNVQGLRALAASLVVIPHFGSLMYVPGAIATFGVSGVDIFFVISGFIMCQVAARPGTGALHFLVRRWWRIFPLYWVVLAFSVLMSVYGIRWAPWLSCQEPVLDYVLLTTTDNCHLPQAWTLVFELYFYASVAFVLLVSLPERFYRTLAIWIAAQIALVVVTGPNGGSPVNAQSLEFALGCAVAWLNARNLIRYELGAWIVGLLLFGAGEYWFVQIATIAPVSRLLTFGAGAAFCLYAYVGWERRGVIVFPKPIVRLGDASYSLYLWHIPLFAMTKSFGIGRVPSLVLIVVVAFASYHLIEAPLLRRDPLRILSHVKSSATRPARLAWERLRHMAFGRLELLRRVWPSLVPFKDSATGRL